MNGKRACAVFTATVVLAGTGGATSAEHGAVSPVARWHVKDIGAPRGARDPMPIDVNDSGTILLNDLSRGRAAVWRHGRWVDLRSLGGGKTEARAISDRGEVAGQSAIGNGQQHAFRWKAGRMIDLIPKNKSSSAIAVNAHGDVAGNVFLGKKRRNRGFLWRRGKVVLLEVAGAESTTAIAINDRGAVVGSYFADGKERGFIWWAGKATDLGVLPDAQWRHDSPQYVEPVVINNRGEVAGYVHGEYAGSQWFIWRHGVMSTFTTSSSSREEQAVAINQRGQVLIQVLESGSGRAWLFDDDRLIRLPTLGGRSTHGAALNDKGQVAGTSAISPCRVRPYVWQGDRMIALSTPARRYTAPTPDVSAINTRGEIVGYDYVKRGQHVLVWRD